MIVNGTFNVTLQPLDTDKQFAEPAGFARLSIDKQFHGDLNASSVGEMLSARISDSQSAGYVALEQVTGELDGKTGSFVLQHFGLMSSDGSELILRVVPDSGRDELAGISGSMTINIVDGEHRYSFDYQL